MESIDQRGIRRADVARSLDPDARAYYVRLLAERQGRSVHPFRLYFPEDDIRLRDADGTIIHSRHRYPAHIEFFSATARYREVGLMAANRIGKTTAGAFAVATWLTGIYRDWWDGRRFGGPVRAWAAGRSNETTRDIVQRALLGNVVDNGSRRAVDGSGMIPPAMVGRLTWKAGVQGLVDTCEIRHASGKVSVLGFKSYEQGRSAYEGTAQHVVWGDEEMPPEIYAECVTRTATTNGVLLHTFTPLAGMSETALLYLPESMRPMPAPDEPGYVY